MGAVQVLICRGLGTAGAHQPLGRGAWQSARSSWPTQRRGPVAARPDALPVDLTIWRVPPPQVGRYMVEVWKAVGMDMTRVQFLNCSEEINSR